MGEETVNPISKIGSPYVSFAAVGRYKSVWRAMRRGLVAEDMTMYPARPFNCRKPTRGRKFNEDKKKIYAELKRYTRIS